MFRFTPLICTLFATLATAQTTAPAVKLTATTQVLSQLTKESGKYSMAASKDHKHIGAIVPDGKRFKFVVNGQTVGTHDWFLPKQSGFFGEKNTLWYAAQDGPEMFVVVGGQKQKPHFEIIPPVFMTPEGQLIYTAREKGGKPFVVIEGKEGTPFDKISEVNVYKTGRVIYVGRRDGATYLVDGTTETKIDARENDSVLNRFGYDGQRVGFIYKVNNAERYVRIDNETFGPYDELTSVPSFAPTGDRWAISAKVKGKWSVVENGKVVAAADDVTGVGYLSDGRLAYFAAHGATNSLVIDGQTVASRPSSLGFDPIDVSPDRRRWAWITKNDAGKQYHIVDGEAQQPFDFVMPIVFSKDSKRFAYYANSADNTTVIVVDGKVIHTLPDAKVAKNSLAFTPDGKHVAYAAGKAKEKLALYVDNVVGAQLSTPVVGSSVVFDDDKTVRFVCTDDQHRVVAHLVTIHPQ